MRPASALFAIAVAAQWFLPLAGVWQHERVVARGTPVRIRCGAPDPYDPFRGRYLRVQPEEREFAAPKGMPEAEAVPVWATLATGEDGLSRIASLAIEPVSGPTVIKLMARRSWQNRERSDVTLEWPFDRLYLNERLAVAADRILVELLHEGKRPVAEIRLLDGQAVLTDVLIDGVSVREIVKQQQK